MTNAADDQPTRNPPSAPHEPADSSPTTPDAGGVPQREIKRQAASVDGIVQEIREQLAGLSAHEIELRRREQTIHRERRRIEQVARSDAHGEFEQARRQLTSKAGLLNAQATAIVAQRRRLDALARQLDQREEGIRARERALEQRAALLQRRVEVVGRRLKTRRQSTSRRIAVVRSVEQTLNRRLEAARDEIARGRTEVRRLRDENETRAAQLAEAEATLRARADALRRETEQAGRQLAQAGEAVEQAAAKRAQLDQQRQQVEAESAALRGAREALSEQREQMQRERRRLQQHDAEALAERAELDAAAEQLAARDDNLRRQHEEVKRRAAELHRQVKRLAERFRIRRGALRRRIGVIRAREEELKQRLHLARDEITHQRDQVQRLHAEAEARAAEVEAAEARLQQRREEVEQCLRDGATREADVVQRFQALDQEHADLARQRLELQQAAQTIELEQAGLDRDRAERQRANAALEEEQHRLETAREALRRAQGEAAATQAHLERERCALRRARDGLSADQARVAKQREELKEAQDKLARERGALSQREQELAQRWQAARAQHQQLVRQREELDVRRRGLQQMQTAADERTQRLATGEQELQEKRNAFEADTVRLAELEAELARRQTTIDEASRRVEELEQRTRAQHEEALALREQAEARDNESRQAALAHELERQELAAEREQLEQAQAELDDWRDRREQELAQVRAALAQQAGRLLAAQRSILAAPRRWWLRSTGLALTAGVVVWFLWLWFHPSLQRATVHMHIASTQPASVAPDDARRWSARVLSEHSRQLLDPHLLAGRADRTAMSRMWQAACARRTAAVVADPQQMSLRLEVTGARASEVARLARSAAECYADRVNRIPADDALPMQLADLAVWQADLEQVLEARREERAADAAALAALPPARERDETAARADQLTAQLAEAAQALGDARSVLAVLLAAEIPAGTVDPAAVEAALRQDTVYREDCQEFRAAAEKFRTELAVSMVLLVGPTQTVQKALADCAASIAEQQALQPPAVLLGVLEDCATDAGQATGKLAAFAERWRGAVETVQNMDVSEDRVEGAVVELVQRQNDAAGLARRMADEAVKMVDEMGARIETLGTTGDGSTREVVVAAVLRSDHAALKAAVEDFLKATQKTALADNVELDTYDRQLRGLRMRLDQRRELVTQRLQLDADRLARQRHNARVEQARSDVLELEERREALVVELTQTLRRTRQLDAAARQRMAAAARVERDDEAIARLEAELTNLAEKLARLRRAGTMPDRVSLGRTIIEPISQTRQRDAVLAGGATLGVVWLLCILMVLKTPWQRGRAELEEIVRAGEAGTAGGAS